MPGCDRALEIVLTPALRPSPARTFRWIAAACFAFSVVAVSPTHAGLAPLPDSRDAKETREELEATDVPGTPVPPETPRARRIRVIDEDTLRTRVVRRPITKQDGGTQIEIITEDGDTATTIRLRGGKVRLRPDDANVVRFGENIVVEEDEEIDGDVVAVGGNIEVRGRVHGSVVAVGGEVTVRPGALVDGDCASIGGGIRKAPGARIQGSDIGMKFVPGALTWLWGMERRVLPIRILGSVVGVLLFALFGWLAETVAGDRLRRIGSHAQSHLWSSLFAGMAILILAVPAIVLLAVTIIGIPLALLSPVVLTVALMLGYVVMASVLGLRLVGTAGQDRPGWMRGMIAGLLLFAALGLVGEVFRLGGGPAKALGLALRIFGLAAAWGAATIGLGSLALTRFGSRDRSRGIAPNLAGPPPPPPSPAL